MDLTEAVREHERLFNEAVRAGDFTDFMKTFTEGAVMSFDDMPHGQQFGPFMGREAIAEAYATRPPDDTMTIWSVEEVSADTADARFDWDAGGGGAMRVKWQDGLVAGMTISFRE
jgi:ketosteroid isomerase-like protein